VLPPALLWILLELATPFVVVDEVNVTAAGRPTRGLETPAAVSVVRGDALRFGPGLGLDDTLRQTPGFSLFRRTSSRTANPTAQGVTLRGLSASGASRSLVLVDGVPVNDPFGGWVAWGRIPQLAIDRVEVVRGPMTDLYGADAAGGVVQIVAASPGRATVRGSFEAGTLGTARGAGLLGAARAAWQGLLAGEVMTTDGSVPVEPASRGAVDTPAGVSSQAVLLGLRRATPGGLNVGVRARGFFEDRTNGTPLQVNDTDSRLISGDGAGALGPGRWQGRAWYGTQGYDQSFSAVQPGRASENLTLRQRVPTTTRGAGIDWSGAVAHVALTAGGDLRVVDGRTVETRYVLGRPLLPVEAGGTQRLAGGFAQARVDPAPAWSIVAGARADRWESDGLDGTAVSRRGFFSPRVSASWRPLPSAALHASVARAFRTPTLNELWRGFRVGDVQTLPNDRLTPERLTSAEIALHVATPRASVRVTAFGSRLDDAIANVTVSSTPVLVTRQRRNAARVGAAGLETEGEWRLRADLHAFGSIALIRSTFDGAREAGLDGRRVPQVPRVHGAVGLRRVAVSRGVDATIVLRGTSAQFEDDRNLLRLGGWAVVDASVGSRLAPGVRWFAAGENLFDREYDVGRTPLRNVGLPRVVRAGVHVAWR
jgi:outer membrane receptor protein involved in Fe transport